MATTTTNYSLTKPAVSETYDIGVFNTNADLIDAAIFTKLNIVNAKWKITDEGGYAIKLTNKSSGNSVKGLVVMVGTSDNSFKSNVVDGDMPIGICYESGVADGQECWVVISGIAEVMLVDSVASTRGYVAYSSASVIGRIDTASSVPAATTHFREIGHTLESKTAGTNVLCKCVVHFN